MPLEVRRKATTPPLDPAITGGPVQTNHVGADSSYKQITTGTIGTDNIGEEKIIYLNGKNSTSALTFGFVLPFKVTRRTADTPDFTVEEGSSGWKNEVDEDIQPRIIADGDTGWKLEVKDQSGDIGTLDWTFRIETKQTFAL